MPKKQERKEKNEANIKISKKFKDELGFLKGLEGDNEFKV
jgi:hypothetical protein